MSESTSTPSADDAYLDPDLLRKSSPIVFELMKFLRRYVVMERPHLIVIALWIIHTHAMEASQQTPYLAVTSPEKQCGKSRLLEVLELLVNEPWPLTQPSEAVLYRTIEHKRPTLLFDEIDTIFNPRSAERYEGIRALLNSGHRRGVKVPRCVGTSLQIVEFSTFGPKVLAGIGTLPDTIADRSIPIRLKRKTSTEKVARFRRRDIEEEVDLLRNQVVVWVLSNVEQLTAARPKMPEQLSDRMQEGCECLVAIADSMGCGESARRALVSLLTSERLDSTESNRLRLLADIRIVFQRSSSKIFTTDLLESLAHLDESPWGSWYGRGIDDRDLGTLLKPYAISSTTVRRGDRVAKGYKREDFHDAWTRYLPE